MRMLPRDHDDVVLRAGCLNAACRHGTPCERCQQSKPGALQTIQLDLSESAEVRLRQSFQTNWGSGHRVGREVNLAAKTSPSHAVCDSILRARIHATAAAGKGTRFTLLPGSPWHSISKMWGACQDHTASLLNDLYRRPRLSRRCKPLDNGREAKLVPGQPGSQAVQEALGIGRGIGSASRIDPDPRRAT